MSKPTVINVAVAVIHYHDKYLLGFRNSEQHQGNRYEFVGGKVESHETPEQALIRELKEEIGLDIYTQTHSNASFNKLGRIVHDYGDKQVKLFIFRVSLDTMLFNQWQGVTKGCEGQPLLWVTKQALIAKNYPLPQANDAILQWLSLSDKISITRTVADDEACQSWLSYHQVHLPNNATVYLRHKFKHKSRQNNDVTTIARLITHLARQRSDLRLIVGCDDYQYLREYLRQAHTTNEISDSQDILQSIVAQHLTQSQLMTLDKQLIPHLNQLHDLSLRQDNVYHNVLGSVADTSQVQLDIATAEFTDRSVVLTRLKVLLSRVLTADIPITSSCHDTASINAMNRLSIACIVANFSTVVAVFISPVNDTLSHPDSDALGWQRFSELAMLADVPVIALGGLAPDDLQKVRTFNGDKVAGIRQFELKIG